MLKCAHVPPALLGSEFTGSQDYVWFNLQALDALSLVHDVHAFWILYIQFKQVGRCCTQQILSQAAQLGGQDMFSRSLAHGAFMCLLCDCPNPMPSLCGKWQRSFCGQGHSSVDHISLAFRDEHQLLWTSSLQLGVQYASLCHHCLFPFQNSQENYQLQLANLPSSCQDADAG